MTAVVDKPKVTPEDLLKMPRDRRYELVDGELVEKPMAWSTAVVTAHLVRLLGNYCEAHKTGVVADSSASYRCFPHDPDRVRKPDISLILRERITPELLEPGHIRIAPDLVVEVVSPNDEVSEVDKRVLDYQRAGVPLLWVVHPESRHVDVYRLGRRGEILSEQHELTGEPVLPGFRLPVREIFRPLELVPVSEAKTGGQT